MEILSSSSIGFAEKVESALSKMGEQILEKTIESIKALGGSLKESFKHFDLLIMAMALVGPAAVGIVSAAFDMNLTSNDVFALGAAAGGTTMVLMEFQDRLRKQLFENKEEKVKSVLYKVGDEKSYNDNHLKQIRSQSPEDFNKILEFYCDEKTIGYSELLTNKAKKFLLKENGIEKVETKAVSKSKVYSQKR